MTLSHKISSVFTLIGYLAASGIAMLWGGYFTTKVTITTVYAALLKPIWAPPAWLFGPVWFLLYISMSIAIWLVWREKTTPPKKMYITAHACWWTQLILNAAWPLVFWLQPAGIAAFATCALLAVCVWICTASFCFISRHAAMFMLPYAIWVSFASTLSWELWRMNSAA